MNAKHTPGPWIVASDGCKVLQLTPVDIDEQKPCPVVVDCASGYFAMDYDEANANAALIAAAPDLLAALEIAEGRLMCIDAQKLDTVARNDDVIDRIRAAIARARGE